MSQKNHKNSQVGTLKKVVENKQLLNNQNNGKPLAVTLHFQQKVQSEGSRRKSKETFFHSTGVCFVRIS